MKFQWSIQSNHTQLVLSQVVYLNYWNEYIWPLTKKMIIYLWSFSFGFFTIHNIWSFWINTSHFKIDARNFWYFNLMNKLLAFGHHTFSYKSLSFFPSQILVRATAFAARYLFSFWYLHLLSSLSNKNKRVGRDIDTSLRMYQNQYDYWLIIHDKLED